MAWGARPESYPSAGAAATGSLSGPGRRAEYDGRAIGGPVLEGLGSDHVCRYQPSDVMALKSFMLNTTNLALPFSSMNVGFNLSMIIAMKEMRRLQALRFRTERVKPSSRLTSSSV